MFRTTGTLLSSMILATSVAVSQPGEGRMEMHMQKGMHEPFIEKLKLSDQQEAQIRKLRVQFQKNQVQVHSQIRMARLDLKELFLAEKLERDAIEKTVRAISGLEQQAKLSRIDHLFAVYEILTPEQRKLWKKHMGEGGTEMRERMHDMRRHMDMQGMIQDDADDDQ